MRPLVLAAAVGTAFAVGTPGSPVRSIGWAIALSVLIAALTTTAAKRPASIFLGLGAAAFIPWLALRMSPWLTAINLLSAAVLLLASLGLPTAGSLRVTVAHHVARIARSIGGLAFGPSYLAYDARRSVAASRSGVVRRWWPSVVVGIGALVLGLAILASGDAVLASFFDIGGHLATFMMRCFAALCGIGAFAVLIGAVHVPGSGDAAPRTRSAPVLPTLFAVGGLAIAIGAYAATQISVAILGADFVKGRTGLTYAEYARGGFFQMAIVALVSALAIGVVRGVLRTSPDAARRLQVGAAVLTIGVVVTVVSAIVKLSVYADTFGLTMLRIYTVVFACWLGVFTLAAFAALLRPASSWCTPVVLGSMFVGAFAMNVADPERIVVEHNLDRADSTGELDAGYLSSLSLDAAPTVFARLDAIDAEYDDRFRGGHGTIDARDEMRRIWCSKIANANDGDGLSFNLARANALDAASDMCE